MTELSAALVAEITLRTLAVSSAALVVALTTAAALRAQAPGPTAWSELGLSSGMNAALRVSQSIGPRRVMRCLWRPIASSPMRQPRSERTSKSAP